VRGGMLWGAPCRTPVQGEWCVACFFLLAAICLNFVNSDLRELGNQAVRRWVLQGCAEACGEPRQRRSLHHHGVAS